MLGIIFVMIGFVLSAVDIPGMVLLKYPEYVTIHDDPQLGEVIQEYVVNNMLGRELRLDIMSDVLGYVFMAIGITLLIKYNIKFLKVYIPLIATAVLYVVVKMSPEIFEPANLVVYALALSFVQLIVEIFMEKTLVYTIAGTTSDLPNERDTVLMKFGWVGAALCQAFLYFIVLVGLADWIIIAYMVARAGFMAFCLERMFRCRHYLDNKKYNADDYMPGE